MITTNTTGYITAELKQAEEHLHRAATYANIGFPPEHPMEDECNTIQAKLNDLQQGLADIPCKCLAER